MTATTPLRLATSPVIVTLVAIFVLCTEHTADHPHSDLTRALHEFRYRPTIARLSGFPYAPARPVGATHHRANLARLDAALQHVRGAAHTLAIRALLEDQPRTAVKQLERLTTADPRNPDSWSDLSAARYQESVAANDAELNVSALAAADQALELDPTHAEALFNRALALESLGTLREATAAFEQYLAADDTSSWAVEARQRIAGIRRPEKHAEWAAVVPDLESAVVAGATTTIEHLVKRYPQQARTWGEGEFLGRWGAAHTDGDSRKAEHWLSVTRAIGAALQRTSGEALLSDAVHAIDASDGKKRSQLALAHVEYRRGRILYSQRHVRQALAPLREASVLFASAASPMAYVSEYYVANALIDDQQNAAATTLAERLWVRVPVEYRALRAQNHWYQALVAQLRWLRAMLFIGANRRFDALGEYRAAIAAFDQLGERENAYRMRGSYASLICGLGEPRAAWHHWRIVLRGASEHGRPLLTEVTLNDAARHEIKRGRLNEARSLLRLELATRTPSPRLHVDVLTSLTIIDAATQRDSSHLDRAYAALKKLQEEALYDEAADELRFAHAAYVERDPLRAVEELGDVIQYRQKTGRLPQLVSAYVARARLHERRGADAEAVADLQRAVAVMESTGERIATAELRDSYFGASADAYQELARLHVRQGHLERAFEVADRSRARLLAEQIGGRSAARESSIQTLQRRLGDNIVVAHYSAFSDRLMIVAVDQLGWRGHAAALGREELSRMANRLVRATHADDPIPIVAEARRLYEVLIKPLRPLLKPGMTLIIIPDATTSRIPFALLRSPHRRWLIEDHVIAYAPSAASFAGDVPELTADVFRLAVVADPAFDPALLPDLPRLPAARAEAAALYSWFPFSKRLVGREATDRAVGTALAATDFVHIAAHALADERDAGSSVIALAPDKGRTSGLLYARDIARLRLHHLQLVFLAGCRTASVTPTNRTVRSLALAFLAAGSRATVGTLWDVEDRAASHLTRSYYERLRRGEAPAEALRTAQNAAISSRRLSPRAWAAYQLHTTGRTTMQAEEASLHTTQEETDAADDRNGWVDLPRWGQRGDEN